MPNIIELPPPSLSAIFLDIYCPRAIKIRMGSTQPRMSTSSEVCSISSPLKETPASKSRCGEVVVRHHGGLVDNGLVLIGKENAVVLFLNFDLADLVLLDHLNKGVVVHLLDLVLREPRHGKEIEEKYREHGDGVVEDQRLFRGFDFFHKRPSNIEWGRLRGVGEPASSQPWKGYGNHSGKASFCQARREKIYI